jgi:hypothetical protein
VEGSRDKDSEATTLRSEMRLIVIACLSVVYAATFVI